MEYFRKRKHWNWNDAIDDSNCQPWVHPSAYADDIGPKFITRCHKSGLKSTRKSRQSKQSESTEDRTSRNTREENERGEKQQLFKVINCWQLSSDTVALEYKNIFVPVSELALWLWLCAWVIKWKTLGVQVTLRAQSKFCSLFTQVPSLVDLPPARLEVK